MILKPSNLVPSADTGVLSEIDLTQVNTFSAQCNTSGTTIKGFKYQVYSGDGNVLLLDQNRLGIFEGSENYTTGPNGEKIRKSELQNKEVLKFNINPSVWGSKITNGKDYQWGIRMYENYPRSAGTVETSTIPYPRTFVCSGFLVGTTKYVIWTANNNLLEEGKYVEIKSTSASQILEPTPPNNENLTLPKNISSTNPYRERHKIEWVDKELGWLKNITKLELDDSFTYNYPDDTPFELYNCSDKHTLTSVYVDPNDIIERGRYIKLQTSSGGEWEGDKWKKIIGYNEETGEVRIQEAWISVPTNGQKFLIGKANIDKENQIDDITTTGYASNKNIVGGVPITGTFKTMSNVWSSTKKRLFIQPNINIKSDGTNPDQIVFDVNGKITRVDIQSQLGVAVDTLSENLNNQTITIPSKAIVDTTFNKLDNTQWLLEMGALVSINDATPPLLPQTPYQVFTDFQDASPMAYFYARKEPIIKMYYKNYNDALTVNYVPITIWEMEPNGYFGKPWRDIKFKSTWTSNNDVQIKYYKYSLYAEEDEYKPDLEPFAESDNIYNTSLEWYFRGFQRPDDIETEKGFRYRVKIKIVDEYGKEFEQDATFNVIYDVEKTFMPMGTGVNCDEMGIDIKVTTPAFVETTDWENKKTVTFKDVDDKNILKIPANKVLNYTNLKDMNSTPYVIPNNFTYYTQFQITGDFADQSKSGEEIMVMEFKYKNNAESTQNKEVFDIVTLTFGGITSFYYDDKLGMTQENKNKFKLLLYINNEPANLFTDNGKSVNYIDLTKTSANFITTSKLINAVQNIDKYIVVEAFPTKPVINTIFVLNNYYIYQGQIYGPGPYTWDPNKGWKIQSEYEYFFLENVNQVPNPNNLTNNQLFTELSVPISCQSTYGRISFYETNNVWLDNSNIETENKKILNTFWYEFYFVSNGKKKKCEIRVNKVRKETGSK